MNRKKVVSVCIITAIALLLSVGGAWFLYPTYACKIIGKIERRIQRIDVNLHLDSYVQKNQAHLLHTGSSPQLLNSPEYWIAHGGGIGNFVYCNSKEAVLDSLQRGFRYIELDLQFTTDGALVAVHEWEQLRQIVGGNTTINSPMSKAEIMNLQKSWRQTPLFAEDIRKLMQEHPDMVLVTDKCQNFKRLHKELPYPERIIVEAAGCYNYLQALRHGFTNVALTAWSVADLQLARKHQLPGVVLSSTVLESEPEASVLAKQLHQDGCCIMVHWASICDQPAFINRHLGITTSRFYTDTWSPQGPPPAL